MKILIVGGNPLLPRSKMMIENILEHYPDAVIVRETDQDIKGLEFDNCIIDEWSINPVEQHVITGYTEGKLYKPYYRQKERW